VTHFKTHVAYAFADQYSAEELLEIEDLYSLPDNEVRERFLHKKRSGLEEIVSAVFYISLPIFLIYFIFNLNITGFSIVNALNKSLILNPFAIAFIILFVVFVYFKIRKRN